MKKPALIVLIIVILLAVCTVVAVWRLSPAKNVDSYQDCVDAGGAIMETYPEQCTINGKSFTNTAQTADSSGYVGLSEQAALDKAKSENKAARVVERDGQALPVTMDFAPGRLNLYVKDGEVYKVVVEGE